MKRKTSRLLFGIVAGFCLILIASWNLENSPEASSQISPTSTQINKTSETSATNNEAGDTNALVVSIADGDTLTAIMDSEPGTEVKVRFLGVNTPETVDPRRPVECFGKEASEFTKSLLSNQRIKLEADPEADEIDKYGRLLRNIYLADGTDVNAELVKQGYAYAYVSFPQNAERKAYLRSLESEAKANLRGLWNPETCPN
ncbi:MAG: thermonuclease family protein [Patescibacteria group bacterium]|nr:thermonuclease family protein [Patescibacteria group bacterium]